MGSAVLESIPVRPPLKWAGGKRRLIVHLAPLWLPYRDRRLVEPFCGGMAVALGLLPTRALLNDINPHVMNFFRWLRRGLVIDLVMENEAACYYAHRSRFNSLIAAGRTESHEAAALFYYLNRTGYNGLCRFNRAGQFNVPFGSHSVINYIRDFRPYRPVLAGWDLSAGSFDSLELAPGDFIYADPPYDVEFVNYTPGGFSWEDQVRLAHWLARHQGPVVVSNQATPRILALYHALGFTVRTLRAPRMISRTGDRTPALEILATRNLDHCPE
jgi:DNA adenine methylase